MNFVWSRHSVRTMRHGLLGTLTAGALVVVWLASMWGCERAPSSLQSATPSEATDFSELFGDHCSGCHGASGELGPAPPLNDPLFLAIVPESVLKDVVRHGRPDTLMTAFGGEGWNALSENQIDMLTSQIVAGWGGGERAPSDAPPYLPPAANGGSEGDPAAGGKLFAEICASCHGKTGRGGKVAGAIDSPSFLGLISDQALRRIVITGRPDLGMPDYRGLGGRRPSHQPLTSQEVADIVALLASWREPDDQLEETPDNEGASPR